MKLIYLKSALKCDSFDVGIGIKIPFFRVLVTIEPGRYQNSIFRVLVHGSLIFTNVFSFYFKISQFTFCKI